MLHLYGTSLVTAAAGTAQGKVDAVTTANTRSGNNAAGHVEPAIATAALTAAAAAT